MELIKATVQEVMQGLQAKSKAAPKNDIRALLNKVLTQKEKEHVEFSYFNKGTLALCVDSSVWLYQLSLQKDKLLSKMNKRTKEIKKIVFHIGVRSEKEKNN